ncbi:hypothetical protein OHB13_37415 (plasmid) [Streptomyces sp. NBC_00440]|uniref:hypothetical protein n=1 Tax=unclassified Streptomyces TaxID=2593676 RepID=UPI002E1C8C7F|nr:hypothetical protein OG760_36770 [Streptomyces sp. NBC_00963]
MSTEQPDTDAYGQELARISHHQHEAVAARFTVFQARAAVGIRAKRLLAAPHRTAPASN